MYGRYSSDWRSQQNLSPSNTRKTGRQWVHMLLVFSLLSMWSGTVLAQEMLKATGVVKANAEATISVNMSARVSELPFREGDAFVTDDVIVRFDCSRNRAILKARKAVEKARRLQVKNNKRLVRHQALGRNELAVSIAALEEAEANSDEQALLVSQCTVRAPFSGRIVRQLINENETPRSNQPLVKIVDTTRNEIELIVPSKWLNWLSVGTGFRFVIEETGSEVAARIIRIGAVVDAVSQTIKVTGEFTEKVKPVLPGMSGSAIFASSGS